MSEMSYPYWEQREDLGQLEYTFDAKSSLVDEAIIEGGFDRKTSYIDPYTFNDPETFIELYCCKKSSDDSSIVSLWNHNEELFGFFCRNYHEKIKCVKYLLEIARDIVHIEYHRKFLDVKGDYETDYKGK